MSVVLPLPDQPANPKTCIATLRPASRDAKVLLELTSHGKQSCHMRRPRSLFDARRGQPRSARAVSVSAPAIRRCALTDAAADHCVDEFAFGVRIVGGGTRSGFEDRALSRLIRVAKPGVGAQHVAKAPQSDRFIGVRC